MFSSSSLWLLFISELPTSNPIPSYLWNQRTGTRRKIIHASISNSMLHPHIMPEEKFRTARDNVCRQNREILRRSESDVLQSLSWNLQSQIQGGGARGLDFSHFHLPPLPASHVVLESMFFQGKDCVLLLKNTRSFKSFGHIIVSFDK